MLKGRPSVASLEWTHAMRQRIHRIHSRGPTQWDREYTGFTRVDPRSERGIHRIHSSGPAQWGREYTGFTRVDPRSETENTQHSLEWTHAVRERIHRNSLRKVRFAFGSDSIWHDSIRYFVIKLHKPQMTNRIWDDCLRQLAVQFTDLLLQMLYTMKPGVSLLKRIISCEGN